MSRKKRLLVWGFIFFFFLSITLIIYGVGSSYAKIDNDVRLKEDSELTYYLDIIYDGKDKDVVTSSDSATSKVFSDYIYVEDKIPDGLEFIGFVNSEDGSIGAVRRSDGVTSCSGYVVDGFTGLKYDPDTRVVSFKVKNLQAGCKLTVGIITKTPFLGEKPRLDFYNTAFLRENDFTNKSNTVHAYLGREDVDLYNVTYQYTGEVPENAPILPDSGSYAEGVAVGVLNNLSLAGYTFSGWTSTDVTVTNSSFVMPANDVIFTGSFTKNQTYPVTYKIEGVMPNKFLPPKAKDYEIGKDVLLDSLKVGDIVSGYRFLGWETTTVDLSEGIFPMPNQAVEIVGRFEEVKYSVSYQFQGTVLPDNAEDLLPSTVSYSPGEIVKLAANPNAPGYKFLGWYKADTFEMPEEDVVIYGEWMRETGKFSPTITKEIANPKAYYSEGDKVIFNITVTNTADFPINDVMLQELNLNSNFVTGTGYTVLSNQFVKIMTIPAKGSIVVNAEYIVSDIPLATVTNTVLLTGALADNDYHLDTSKTYQSSISFEIANLSLEILMTDIDNNLLTDADFGLYSDLDCTDLISSGLLFEKLTPNTTYYLKELRVPTGYMKLNDILLVNVSKDGIINIEGYVVENNNGKAKVQIINQEINILPNTGGIGTIPFVIGGVVIILTGAFGFLYWTKKRGDEDDNNQKNKK